MRSICSVGALGCSLAVYTYSWTCEYFWVPVIVGSARGLYGVGRTAPPRHMLAGPIGVVQWAVCCGIVVRFGECGVCFYLGWRGRRPSLFLWWWFLVLVQRLVAGSFGVVGYGGLNLGGRAPGQVRTPGLFSNLLFPWGIWLETTLGLVRFLSPGGCSVLWF